MSKVLSLFHVPFREITERLSRHRTRGFAEPSYTPSHNLDSGYPHPPSKEISSPRIWPSVKDFTPWIPRLMGTRPAVRSWRSYLSPSCFWTWLCPRWAGGGVAREEVGGWAWGKGEGISARSRQLLQSWPITDFQTLDSFVGGSFRN